jgi:hypothetical protein
VDDAVEIICEATQLEQFRATAQSQRILDDLLLAARVKASLVRDYPKVQTSASGGVVTVDARFNMTQEPELGDRIKEMAQQVSGVKEVRMHALPVSPYACDSCVE